MVLAKEKKDAPSCPMPPSLTFCHLNRVLCTPKRAAVTAARVTRRRSGDFRGQGVRKVAESCAWTARKGTRWSPLRCHCIPISFRGDRAPDRPESSSLTAGLWCRRGQKNVAAMGEGASFDGSSSDDPGIRLHRLQRCVDDQVRLPMMSLLGAFHSLTSIPLAPPPLPISSNRMPCYACLVDPDQRRSPGKGQLKRTEPAKKYPLWR